jgi:hypothetical protein
MEGVSFMILVSVGGLGDFLCEKRCHSHQRRRQQPKSIVSRGRRPQSKHYAGGQKALRILTQISFEL